MKNDFDAALAPMDGVGAVERAARFCDQGLLRALSAFVSADLDGSGSVSADLDGSGSVTADQRREVAEILKGRQLRSFSEGYPVPPPFRDLHTAAVGGQGDLGKIFEGMHARAAQLTPGFTPAELAEYYAAHVLESYDQGRSVDHPAVLGMLLQLHAAVEERLRPVPVVAEVFTAERV